MPTSDEPKLPFENLQGGTVYPFFMPCVRHFILRIDNPDYARRTVGQLLNPTSKTAPQITTTTHQAGELEYGLVMGFTYQGLTRLNLPECTFQDQYYGAFKAGAAARANRVGDVAESAPEHWTGQLGTPDVHAIVSLYVLESDELAGRSDAVRTQLSKGRAFTELSSFDGAMLPKIGNGPGIRIHFDYTDGISQPIIEGASRRSSDMQPVVSSHHFFLQEESPSYRIPEPKQLSLYGSFQVLRVLEQDVVGFENFLQSQSHIIDPELLAAKMMGRWRNGVPLILSSDTDTPSPPIPYEEYNNYNYIRTQNNPDDTLGLRCPLGAHMRRSNPRADRVQGGSVEIHRILRRGMPYGPPYDPNKPYDGIERGLLGIFICASIENQFEFLMQDWVNRGGFIANLPATEKDPILGDNTPEESAFTIPNQNGPLKITGFQRFIKARGGAYFFLPSIAGLNYIAGRMST